LIRESIRLQETRKTKQEFYDQVRSKYPDIDRAFFVHWVGEERRQWDTLDERIEEMTSGTTDEYSCNLIDPAGMTIDSHRRGNWGSIGIVFQGIATFGSVRDVHSYRVQTDSGVRAYPRVIRSPKEETDRLGQPQDRFLNIDLTDNPKDQSGSYSSESNLARVRPSVLGMNFNDQFNPEPFLAHQPRFPYSEAEFLVIPKTVHAVVYIPENDGTRDPFTPDYIEEFIAKHGDKYPLVQGKNNIGNLYRNLYRGS